DTLAIFSRAGSSGSSFSRAPSLCGANWGKWLCQFGSQAAITVSGAAKVLSRLPRFICGPSRYLAAGDCTSVNRKGWERSEERRVGKECRYERAGKYWKEERQEERRHTQ